MDPAQIRAVMSGILQPNRVALPKKAVAKERYEIAIEEEIEAYIASHPEELVGNALVSPKMQALKLRNELKEASSLPLLSHYLKLATTVLKNDGVRYLEPTLYRHLVANFAEGAKRLKEKDLKSRDERSLQEQLGISEESLHSIVEIANLKFEDRHYHECVALFALLTTLNPLDPSYWFRLGAAADQEAERDLAINSYKVALEIDPSMAEAHLFIANRFLEEEKIKEAREACHAARKIVEAEQNRLPAEWISLLGDLESYIALSEEVAENGDQEKAS